MGCIISMGACPEDWGSGIGSNIFPWVIDWKQHLGWTPKPTFSLQYIQLLFSFLFVIRLLVSRHKWVKHISIYVKIIQKIYLISMNVIAVEMLCMKLSWLVRCNENGYTHFVDMFIDHMMHLKTPFMAFLNKKNAMSFFVIQSGQYYCI